MLRIGITGGIGSGKSTVCSVFRTLGIPIYVADDEAKKIMATDRKVKTQLVNAFGKETFDKNDELNRKYLSGIVFDNKEQLKILNSIVHPALWQHIIDWNLERQQENHLYTLQEAAILFEGGGNKFMDGVILVFADQEERIIRTMKRDRCSREEVLARMSKQMPEEEKKKLADYVIHNNSGDEVIPQVLELHERLKQKV